MTQTEPIREESITTQKESTTTQKEPIETQKESTTTQKEPATPQKESTMTQKEPIETQKESNTTQKESSLTQKEHSSNTSSAVAMYFDCLEDIVYHDCSPEHYAEPEIYYDPPTKTTLRWNLTSAVKRDLENEAGNLQRCRRTYEPRSRGSQSDN